MGGKGIRRRAKNYREAHGGYSRLPPPPDPSQVDTLPSKLRKILSYSTPSESQGSLKLAKDAGKKRNKNGVGVGAAQPENAKDEVELEETSMEDGDDPENCAPQHSDEKKKKKRKRKPVLDLRFKEELEKSRGRLKRKERKKKYLEAKKNKKGKKGESVDDFPGRENIRFGEVVQAPPKLVAPKALKNVQDASKERVRVKAIEAYRQRKKWNSRPGIQLPPPVTASLHLSSIPAEKILCPHNTRCESLVRPTKFLFPPHFCNGTAYILQNFSILGSIIGCSYKPIGRCNSCSSCS